jgi:DNA topoisomerase VI subunit B
VGATPGAVRRDGPRYLVPEPPEGLEPHTGTTDLDVVIGVAVLEEDESVYTKLQEELTRAGFAPRTDASFAWERRVDGISVVLEFFCPVEEGGRPGRLRRNPGGDAGSSISAIQMKGAELAGHDCSPHTIEAEILDHGGWRGVDFNVVNLLPFIVLKAFALESRDKEKDAYDLVWTLNAFGDGPASAADAAAMSPIAENPLVTEAIEILTESFERVDSQGPSNYARFFLGGSENEEARERLRRQAHGTVGHFLVRWREVHP